MTENQKQEWKNRTAIEIEHVKILDPVMRTRIARKTALRKMVIEGAENLTAFEQKYKDLKYMSHETNEIIGKQLLLVSAYVEML